MYSRATYRANATRLSRRLGMASGARDIVSPKRTSHSSSLPGSDLSGGGTATGYTDTLLLRSTSRALRGYLAMGTLVSSCPGGTTSIRSHQDLRNGLKLFAWNGHLIRSLTLRHWPQS